VIEIRRAGLADAAAMAAIQGGVFDHAWPVEDIAALVDASPALALIAHEEGTAVGFILGRVVADEAEILSIGVAAAEQGRGIAGRLLARWLDAVNSAGAGRAFLEVAADNRPALALYQRHGFAVTGRRDGYYHRRDGSLGDALMMMAEFARR
jgi:ribosomal-protein-alanine N-acetyltransferase